VAALVTVVSIGSQGVASSMASHSGGADKSRPATFGECKHLNLGKHNGYDCGPEIVPGGGE
jgi:hypothetical protein